MSARESDACVRVVVRCRPLNAKETAEGRQRIVEVDQAAASVTLRPAGGGPGPVSRQRRRPL